MCKFFVQFFLTTKLSFSLSLSCSLSFSLSPSLSLSLSLSSLLHLRDGVEGELNGSLGGFQVWVGAGLTEEVLTGFLTVSGTAHVTGSVFLHANQYDSHQRQEERNTPLTKQLMSHNLSQIQI